MTKTITITRGDAGPLKPKLLPLSDKIIKATLKEIDAGEKYSLEVTVKPPFPKDTLRAKLQIETGVTEDPMATIPVYASVPPRVAAVPSRIIVPTMAQANWKQTIRLTWDSPEPHKILSATVTDPKIIAQVNDSKDAHQVVLGLASAELPPMGAYTLTITTDDAKAPQVKVPINVGGRRGKPVSARNARITTDRLKKRGGTLPKAKPSNAKVKPNSTKGAKPKSTKGAKPK